MSFAPFQIPTPTIIDRLQYPLGTKPGVDTATDLWEVDGSGESWLFPQVDRWVDASILYDGHLYRDTTGGFYRACYKADISPDQWVSTQCIIPINVGGTVSMAVRANVIAGTGYILQNYGYTDEADWLNLTLMRANGIGQGYTVIHEWNISDWSSNEFYVDGVRCGDGFFAMVEVAGSDPVEFRVSYGSSGTSTDSGWGVMVELPDFRLGNSGNPAIITLPVVYDSSLSRITGGKLGLWGPGSSVTETSGGAYNFQGGEVSGFSGPVTAIIKSALADGGSTALASAFIRYIEADVRSARAIGLSGPLIASYIQYQQANRRLQLKGIGGINYPFHIKTT
jgi:hypothetical protein